ncbi:TolC family protein [Psychrosphaera haliotis]|nr:TolC family protein [Psychrosphaera haliotis]
MKGSQTKPKGTVRHVQLSAITALCFSLMACSSNYQMSNDLKEQRITGKSPEQWTQQLVSNPDVLRSKSVFEELNNPQLKELVEKALLNNLSLQQQAFDVKIKEQSLIATGTNVWPSLNAEFSGQRGESSSADSPSTSYTAGLSLRYELDVWQKLSDTNKQENLQYMAEQAFYTEATQALISNVILSWLDVIEANQLLELYKQRVQNSEQSLSIIDSGYQQGLNSALDVYLARNELNSERSRLALQVSNKATAIRVLERLIGEYPSASLLINADIPVFTNDVELGIPSELIKNKPSLQASWYQLMATDAALAFAHKERFPDFVLTGTLSDSASKLSDVFSTSAFTWGLVGKITAPLFDAGRLKANEKAAELRLQQAEKSYIEDVYDSFEDIENALSLQVSLVKRYATTYEAMENAMAAEQLAFEQYQSGLVTYTTVLDAQGRSFDAQTSLIQIKKQRATNRVQLQQLLGHSFSNSNSLKTTDDGNND